MEHETAAGPDETAAGPDEAAGLDEAAAGPDAWEPERQVTGEPRVDRALTRLDELAGLQVSEHPAVFEDVHASLRAVLGELDLGTGPAGGQRRQGG
jgi:hypothetical protein